jgi:hypothetical protein
VNVVTLSDLRSALQHDAAGASTRALSVLLDAKASQC